MWYQHILFGKGCDNDMKILVLHKKCIWYLMSYIMIYIIWGVMGTKNIYHIKKDFNEHLLFRSTIPFVKIGMIIFQKQQLKTLVSHQ